MQLTLKKNDVIVIKNKGLKINCLSGVFYVTQAKDPNDYILKTGDNFDIAKDDKVVVQAIQPSNLQFCYDEAKEKNSGIYQNAEYMEIDRQRLVFNN